MNLSLLRVLLLLQTSRNKIVMFTRTSLIVQYKFWTVCLSCSRIQVQNVFKGCIQKCCADLRMWSMSFHWPKPIYSYRRRSWIDSESRTNWIVFSIGFLKMRGWRSRWGNSRYVQVYYKCAIDFGRFESWRKRRKCTFT